MNVTRKQLKRRTKEQLIDALLLCKDSLEQAPTMTLKEVVNSEKKWLWKNSVRLALDTIYFGDQSDAQALQ